MAVLRGVRYLAFLLHLGFPSKLSLSCFAPHFVCVSYVFCAKWGARLCRSKRVIARNVCLASCTVLNTDLLLTCIAAGGWFGFRMAVWIVMRLPDDDVSKQLSKYLTN